MASKLAQTCFLMAGVWGWGEIPKGARGVTFKWVRAVGRWGREDIRVPSPENWFVVRTLSEPQCPWGSGHSDLVPAHSRASNVS